MVDDDVLAARRAGHAVRVRGRRGPGVRGDRCGGPRRGAPAAAARTRVARLAAATAFGITLPVFLAFEPDDTGERITATLLAASVVGASIIARGAWRAIAAWRATRAVSAAWQRRGRRLDGFDVPIPAYAVEEEFPTVAVVGCVRPVLFVAERVLRECTGDEVRAMVSHECAHLTARDNVKRFFIRACPDMLPRAGALERAWSTAAEEAADAAAVAANPAFALDLAQALIRVARLAPAAPAVQDLPASALYRGEDLNRRIHRLLAPPAAVATPDRLLGYTIAFGIGLSIIALKPIHDVVEVAVKWLP
jgi:Peptidase family M48